MISLVHIYIHIYIHFIWNIQLYLNVVEYDIPQQTHFLYLMDPELSWSITNSYLYLTKHSIL